MRPLRTWLFVPGNRPNMIEKALDLPADVLIFDLEDSVPASEKEAARDQVAELLSHIQPRGQQIFVRINSLASGLAKDDLKEIVRPKLDGVTLPKINSAEDIQEIEREVERLERERGIAAGQVKLAPWLETAQGVVNAYVIATASPRVVGLAFGADDFTLDMGIVRSEEGTELFLPRAQVAIAAMAAGVAPLDTPYVNYRDEAGLVKDAQFARQLGFKGKCLIHPSQVEPVNRIFSPSPEEVNYARRVMAAFEEAVTRGSAVTTVDGRMIDVPVAERARKLLELAEAIAQEEKTTTKK